MNFTLTPSGARVAYQLNGEQNKTPLILLHGFCEDQTVWTPVLSALTAGPVLNIDLPGFGASELPATPSMETYAEAVLAVLKAAQISRCVLVGHSMGGYAALEFASRWPQYLAGLGLVHSHPYQDNEERKTARRRGIETLQAGKRDLYVSQLFPNLFAAKYLEQHPEVINALIANGKKQSPEGIAAGLQAMIDRKDHQATLSGLKACPVLFILGEQDTLVPQDQGLKAALLPEVTDLQLLPEVAHMSMFETPEKTALILNSFWDFCAAG